MIQLYDYQQGHAEKLLTALTEYGAAKDGSDCGTGKTPVAAWVTSKYAPEHCVIVCPKILVPSWTGWVAKTGVKTYTVINYEMLRTGNHPLVRRVKHRPAGRRKAVEYFVWDLDPATSLIIWDEDHTVAGNNTLNSRMSRAASVQKIPQLYLGATSADGPHKMWALGFALGFHAGTDQAFTEWALEMGCWKDMFRELQFKGQPDRLEELHSLIYKGSPPRGSRMRIAELGDKFPANQICTELYEVDTADQIQRCYEELTEQLETLDLKESEDFDSELVYRLRARQRAELYKVPLLCELIELHLHDGLSVPVFVSFRDSIYALSDYLQHRGIEHSIVTGGMKADEQQEMLKRFQSNKVRVILLIDSAGGVGIDLHDTDGRYPRCTLINPTDNAVVFKQVLGRAHRATGRSPVIQKIVCAKGTAEENVYNNLRAKIRRISVINDADVRDSDLDAIQRRTEGEFTGYIA